MSLRPYKQVDVFTATPYFGNALAVVLDSDGMAEEEMLRFANWMNLAETTFVLRPTQPGADYRVRIFTTTTELPFAGHPTLGTAHAWLEAGGAPARPGVVVQECPAGLIEVRAQAADDGGGHRLALKAPPLVRTGPLEEDVLEWALAGLGLARTDVVAHQWIANGPQWAGLLLRDAELVLALEPDFAVLEGLEVGVIGPHASHGAHAVPYRESPRPVRRKGARAELEPLPAPEAPGLPAGTAFQSVVASAPADFEVRAFVPGEGLPEDPATGSLNAGFAVWLTRDGLAPEHYTVRQGTRLGRAGLIEVSTDTEGIWVAGQAVTCIEGKVRTR
ncbi:PhzF family phenazine biosynthesis protein [Zafaria cholistanensis]|nr:PhzF family phenazine biosynthesis protein [Zafaria cholistanensis]